MNFYSGFILSLWDIHIMDIAPHLNNPDTTSVDTNDTYHSVVALLIRFIPSDDCIVINIVKVLQSFVDMPFFQSFLVR